MKHLRSIYLIPAVLVVLLVGAFVGISSRHSVQKSDAQPVSTVKAAPKQSGKYSNAQIYKVGHAVQWASVSETVNSVKAQASITGPYESPVFADPGTKFVVINETVTNTTDSPFTYPEAILIDQKDRAFDEYNNTIGNIPDYLQGQELSPSVPKTGNIVFQVPNDTTTVRVGGYVGNTKTLKLVEATL